MESQFLRTISYILHSGKLWREKTFGVFRCFTEPSANVFSAKFCEIRNAYTLRVCGCDVHAHMRELEGHTMYQHIIIGPEQSTKVLSAKFCQNAKDFRYNNNYDTYR